MKFVIEITKISKNTYIIKAISNKYGNKNIGNFHKNTASTMDIKINNTTKVYEGKFN